MPSTMMSITDTTSNPLDTVEELVMANDWPFERSGEDELLCETAGRGCNMRMYFVWQEEYAALQFCCQFDFRVPPASRPAINELLSMINEKLWVGHFDLSSEENTPMFRQTLLTRGQGNVAVEQIEDLVEVALGECDRYYPAFQFVIWGGKSPRDAMFSAILDPVGEA